ncbi:MAG: hypothetical protein L6V89_04920 [Oscillospiraceae bacterium]|nr:MAG: hypothetical protein L6V89_04920 [Oscillospiraceae bacterium]
MDREKMRLRLDVNNMMDTFVGEHGISQAELEAVSGKAREAFESFQANRGTGMTGWSELPYNQEEVVCELLKEAKRIREGFESFVVLGIGGSALGPIAVQQALNHLHYNELPAEKRGGPRLYVEDNVDPERMEALLDVVNPETACFNVITKSGSTSETMTQYLVICDILKKRLGDRAKEHIVATTSADRGNLIKLVKSEGYRAFIIPDGVGGRFSELCPVGLLAAAVCGIDIRELLEGAKFADQMCASGDIYKNPALMAAAMQYIAMGKGCNISVMMPYADSLKYIADWYCQLWGESLGKRYSNSGSEVCRSDPCKGAGRYRSAQPDTAVYRGTV